MIWTSESLIVTEIIGTGACPNLIWEDIMPPNWLTKVQSFRASIRAACGMTFTVEGVVRLSVEIGGQVTTAVFEVALRLTAKLVFEMALIDEEISRIETKNGQVGLSGDNVVEIFESFKGEADIQFSNDVVTMNGETSGTNQPTLRLAKNTTIPSKSEALETVLTTEGGTFVVESVPHKTCESHLQVARGTVETQPNKPFCILVINKSKSYITLLENMKVGQLREAPSTIVQLRDVLSAEHVNTMPIYEGMQNKEQ